MNDELKGLKTSTINGADLGYLITEDGRVWSNKCNKWMRAHKKKGYMFIQLRNDGGHMYKSIHRLVAEAFIPNPANKRCVNHKDFNVENNHVDNLEWMTDSENQTYSYKNGRRPNQGKLIAALGRQCSKIAPDQVPVVRARFASKIETLQQIADDYGVHRETIGRLCRKVTYKESK